MQFNLEKNLKRIFSALGNIDRFPRLVIKYGTQAFLLLFALGTLLVVLNHTSVSRNYYDEYIATTIIKTSFTILAEAIIGGLIIDFVFKKKDT